MPDIPSIDPRRRPALFALLFYFVAALFVSAPLPMHVFSTVARAVRQDVWLNLWALAWTSDHMVTRPTGLFNANIFFPHQNTLAYTDHFIGQALLAAPVYWATDNIALAYNVAWFAALVLTAWGGYLWVRCLVGGDAAGEAAALVAGAFCLLVPGKRVAFSHLQVISLQGVTLALYATHMLFRRADGRAAVGLAAATVYAALCSWYTAAYTALMLPVVGWFGARYGVDEELRRRVLILGAAALIGAALVMAPVATPFRAVQAEFSFERPLAELIETSLRPVDFVSSWSWLHGAWFPQGSGAGGHFPGILAVVLAFLGIRDGRRRGDPWPLFYAALALAFAVLSLGPRLPIGDASIPLPYEFLYRWVPGFGALRNAYRAAFFAAILLAVPVGYGARWVIEAARGRMLYEQRWRTQPRLRGADGSTWGIAVLLACVHLFEAWPGPQQVTPLPEAPSGAYRWLAEEAPDAAALVWPLPRPFDDNARYQLWSVGNWGLLANGHSGVYPPDFVSLYSAGAEFPDPRFLDFVRERFPIEYVVAHYGLAPGAEAVRDAAASGSLSEIWAEGDDVIYRIDNGAAGGWLRRRLPQRMVGDRMLIEVATEVPGCGVRVLADGVTVGEARLPSRPDTVGEAAYLVDLDASFNGQQFVELELFLTDTSGAVRVDLRAALRPRREALLEINGAVVERGPLVVAVVDAASGSLKFRAVAAADASEGADAVRQALDAAREGDELVLAVAEEFDYRLIERLRLLLDEAGVGDVEDVLEELGTTYAFRGTVGSPRGTAREVIGEDNAALLDPLAADCRLGSIPRFRFDEGASTPS